MNSTNESTVIQSNSNESIFEEVAQINQADTCWVLICVCLVFIMIPGLGYFYGGITSKKNFLTMLLASILAVAINSIQWFGWGYSLAFSQTGSVFIGNFDNVALLNVGNDPHTLAPTIPENTFMIFQCMFACITPALAFGSVAERTPILTFVVFTLIWSTFVYDFIAYWNWAPNGWLHNFGVLDFAGGTPVHITSGFSALAYALAVGPRRTVDFKKLKPSNPADLYLGTALLWFGWFGFNAGSEMAINYRAVNALVVSNIAASMGGLTWVLAEMIRQNSRKISLNGFCTGAVVGLVTITPACGFVRPHFAFCFGFLGAIASFFACSIKNLTDYKWDDACDVFGVHGVGGIVGCILTGFFADNSLVIESGDAPILGGFINQNYIQVAIQLLAVAASASWSFILTFLILQIVGFIPGLRLKLTEEEEHIGSDLVELGERAYGHDMNEFNETLLNNMQFTKESNFEILKSYFQKITPKKIKVKAIHQPTP
jgi:Amt family ammonium transporter